MVRLPVVSGRKLLATLKRAGFVEMRRKGDHVSLKRRTPRRVYKTVVPLHDEVARGTLRDILNQAGLTKEQLVQSL